MAKQGKAPTREQKEILSGHHMDAKKWRFVKRVTESYLQFVNTETGQLKTVDIYKKSKNKWGDDYEN